MCGIEKKAWDTFKRASELENVLSNRDDFRADAIAGKESDGVSLWGCCGGAADSSQSDRRGFGEWFWLKVRFEWPRAQLQRSRHWRSLYLLLPYTQQKRYKPATKRRSLWYPRGSTELWFITVGFVDLIMTIHSFEFENEKGKNLLTAEPVSHQGSFSNNTGGIVNHDSDGLSLLNFAEEIITG